MFFFQIVRPFQKTWTLHSNLGLVYRYYSSTSMLGNDKSVIYKLWHSIIVMIYTKSKMTTSLKITNCNLETPYKANYKIWHAFFISFVFNYKECRSSFLETTWKIVITPRSTLLNINVKCLLKTSLKCVIKQKLYKLSHRI